MQIGWLIYSIYLEADSGVIFDSDVNEVEYCAEMYMSLSGCWSESWYLVASPVLSNSPYLPAVRINN